MNNQNKPIFQPDGKNSIHDGIEHEPSAGKALFDMLAHLTPTH